MSKENLIVVTKLEVASQKCQNNVSTFNVMHTFNSTWKKCEQKTLK
jgi:hypothetical protein